MLIDNICKYHAEKIARIPLEVIGAIVYTSATAVASHLHEGFRAIVISTWFRSVHQM